MLWRLLQSRLLQSRLLQSRLQTGDSGRHPRRFLRPVSFCDFASTELVIASLGFGRAGPHNLFNKIAVMSSGAPLIRPNEEGDPKAALSFADDSCAQPAIRPSTSTSFRARTADGRLLSRQAS